MRQNSRFVFLAAPLAFAACAVVPPAGPSVMALPGKDKNFAAFQQDDATCRQYAFQQGGGVQPADAATNNAVGSAVIGTALGAVAGAAIGSVTGNFGAGAAIGGGAGLLAGSAVGASNAQYSSAGLQQRYDISYTQCMYGQGNTIQPASTGYGYSGYSQPGYSQPGYSQPGYSHPGYFQPGYFQPGYSYPAPYGYPGYYAPPPDYDEPNVIVGGGWGWRGGYRGYHGW